MELQIATFEVDGRFALPQNVKDELGIQPGSQYQVTVHDRQIVLEPIRRSAAEATSAGRPIDRLRAMLAGGPSLEDDLLEWRRSGKW